MIEQESALLILPHFKVQNANAISSPLTWGFPAVSAFLGFTHALERKLRQHEDYADYQMGGVGIICHDFSPQIARTSAWQEGTFCLTRNPVDDKGETPSLVEEGRVHLEVSLIIEVSGKGCNGPDAKKKFIAEQIRQIAQTLRLAGGSIFFQETDLIKTTYQPQLVECGTDEEVRLAFCKKYLRPLLPGFVLLNRADLLSERVLEMQQEKPEATALDALLDFSGINYEPEVSDSAATAGEALWNIRKKPGWLVPIPVGYAAISELYAPGTVLNARDQQHPVQLVECIYSLGQWLGLHRVHDFNDIFWRYQFDAEQHIYSCVNHPQNLIYLTQGA